MTTRPIPSAARRLVGCLALTLLALHGAAALAASSEELSRTLRARLAGEATVAGVPFQRALSQRFYDAHAYRPLWVGPRGPNARAGVLRERLGDAGRDGLRPGDYSPEALARLWDSRAAKDQVELELLLTRELLHYVSDLRSGRLSPKAVDRELFVHGGEVDRAEILRAAREHDDLGAYLTGMAPSNPVYRRLRRALAEYRAIERAGGWPPLPDGPSLKPGQQDPRVAILRARLRAGRDLSLGEGAEPTLFDAQLEQAVQRFQARHGLETDGVVGPKTRAHLNIPMETRIRQILLNMERWRWMPDDLGDRYILVNLAGFELEVVESGAQVMAMRVVVGKPYRKTPVFTGQMTYLDFNPTWTIPPTISRKDILPEVRADPAYLVRKNIRVFEGWGPDARELDPMQVDWHAFDRIPYRLTQDPGPENALGRVKFMFPNSFHVYLHDTPSRELFQRTVRTFSSGCIRVEKPLELAEYLLGDKPGWGRTKIQQVIATGKTTTVRLTEPLPVHLTYSTVWIGEGGTVHFRDDVYGRDTLLSEALHAQKTTPHAARAPDAAGKGS